MKTSTTLLITGLALALTGSAQAEMRIAHDGVGDAVYIPWYTVENGNVSLLTISNHGVTPTMARVQLSEHANGQAALWFDVALPSYGVFTAAISKNANGLAQVQVNDDLCTAPTQTAPWSVNNYDLVSYPDAGGTDATRGNTGAIEVIEYASLTGALSSAAAGHDCDAIVASYADAQRGEQLAEPTHRISAQVEVINVAQGTLLPIPGTAIAGLIGSKVDATLSDRLRLTTPTLAADQDAFVSQTASGIFRFDATLGIDAVTSLFMTSALTGAYSIDPALAADTDWVVSFPTKQAYAAKQADTLVTGDSAFRPFTRMYGECDDAVLNAHDRSGAGAAGGTAPGACLQTQVIDFNGLAAEVVPANGYASYDIVGDGHELPAERLSIDTGTWVPVTIVGLPALGVRLSNYVNGNVVDGVLANYASSLPLERLPPQVITTAE